MQIAVGARAKRPGEGMEGEPRRAARRREARSRAQAAAWRPTSGCSATRCRRRDAVRAAGRRRGGVGDRGSRSSTARARWNQRRRRHVGAEGSRQARRGRRRLEHSPREITKVTADNGTQQRNGVVSDRPRKDGATGDAAGQRLCQPLRYETDRCNRKPPRSHQVLLRRRRFCVRSSRSCRCGCAELRQQGPRSGPRRSAARLSFSASSVCVPMPLVASVSCSCVPSRRPGARRHLRIPGREGHAVDSTRRHATRRRLTPASALGPVRVHAGRTPSISGVRPSPSGNAAGEPRIEEELHHVVIARATPRRGSPRLPGATLDSSRRPWLERRTNVDAGVEQLPDAGRIAGPGALRKQLAAHRLQLGDELRLAPGHPRRCGRVAHRAGRDQPIDAVQHRFGMPRRLNMSRTSLRPSRAARATAVRPSSTIYGDRRRSRAAARRSHGGCRAQARDGSPSGPAFPERRVRAVLEQIPDTVAIVPVDFPQQHQPQAGWREHAGVDEQPQHRVVAGLGRVVRDLHVVRIAAALEEQLRHGRVVGYARRSVHRRLELAVQPEARVRIRARVEERRRRAQEPIGAGVVAAEVLRQAEIHERLRVSYGPAFAVAHARSSATKRRTASSSPTIAAVWISAFASEGLAASKASASPSAPCQTAARMNAARSSSSVFDKAIACVAVVVDAVLLFQRLDRPEIRLRVRAGDAVAKRLARVKQDLLETAVDRHVLVRGEIASAAPRGASPGAPARRRARSSAAACRRGGSGGRTSACSRRDRGR